VTTSFETSFPPMGGLLSLKFYDLCGLNCGGHYNFAQNNDVLLLDYLERMENLLQYASKELKERFGDTTDSLNAAITACQTQRAYLEKAIDISVYRVELSKEQYAEMKQASDTFHYEGRIVAAKNLYNRFVVGDATALSQRGLFQQAKESLGEGVGSYGYSCKLSILPERIRSKVDEENSFILPNPAFSNKHSNAIVIYVLDANDPKKVLSEGVRYNGSSFNPLGNIIFFHHIKDAFKCAHLRADGLLYDKDNGWRRYHVWTDQERVEPRLKIKAAIQDTSRLAGVAADIVGEYLDIPFVATPVPGNRR